MTSKEQIQKLQGITEDIINQSEQLFSNIDEAVFNHNTEPKSWSVAQCINHLNHYADFYHKQFKNILNREEKKDFKAKSDEVKYSWLTRNFLKYVQLNDDDQVQKKTKAPKKTYQVNSDFTKKEFDKFMDNQKELLSLLKMAESQGAYRFKKVKTMFPLLKMKALDMLTIHVHHNYRHFIQAKNTLEKVITQSN